MELGRKSLTKSDHDNLSSKRKEQKPSETISWEDGIDDERLLPQMIPSDFERLVQHGRHPTIETAAPLDKTKIRRKQTRHLLEHVYEAAAVHSVCLYIRLVCLYDGV